MNSRGAKAEDVAARYLGRRGYKIVGRNFHSRFGEIDIIAEKDGFLVFVEVKARKEGALVGGVESVDRRKIGRIVKTASIYLSRCQGTLQPRFDVIEAEITERAIHIKNHIQNAF